MTLMLSAKADGAVATEKQARPSVPERERDIVLGRSYQAEEAKQLNMEASSHTFQKVGLLERSVSATTCGWT